MPESVFLFVSGITPLINVDLLIKDEQHVRSSLGAMTSGWHIPGGIIRYKESAADRVRAVAHTELGADLARSDLRSRIDRPGTRPRSLLLSAVPLPLANRTR